VGHHFGAQEDTFVAVVWSMGQQFGLVLSMCVWTRCVSCIQAMRVSHVQTVLLQACCLRYDVSCAHVCAGWGTMGGVVILSCGQQLQLVDSP
jgi:hypothetical protein